MDVTTAAIAICFLAAAALYSSVGHAGASGYLAVMALFGMAPAAMRPTALMLNILVALVAATKFYRAGFFSGRLLWPFAVTSAPAAYVGGRLVLPLDSYRAVVGVLLLFAAWRMYRSASRPQEGEGASPPALLIALATGLAIGLLSGLTGIGGGMFLSPLLLMRGWATTRVTAGVVAVFILLNSAAGLLGVISSVAFIPAGIALWAPAVLVGGWVGSEYGSRRLAAPILRQLLAIVLVLAALKLIFA